MMGGRVGSAPGTDEGRDGRMIRFGRVSALIAHGPSMGEPKPIDLRTDRSMETVEWADAGRRSILCEARRG